MNWILDLILIAIVLISTVIVAKKGFVKTVFNIVGFVLAIVLALSFCEPIADFTYEKFAEPSVRDSIIEAVNTKTDKTNAGIRESIEKSSLPDFVKNKLSDVDFTKYGNKSEDIADAVCTQVVKPLAVGFIKAIVFLLLFIILSILAKILATAMNKVCSFSIVGKTNKLLGGILGFVFGLAMASVFIAIIEIILSLNGEFFGISQATVDSAYIFKNALAVLPFNVK